MAYIVLAVGAVMALLGALAIITGYPIIQIERGWATVIAGSTLLAGGVVTMAIGLMLRAISDVCTALTNASFVSPDYTAAATLAPRHAEPAFGVEPDHAPIDHAPIDHTPVDHTPNYASAALGAAAIAVPAAALAMTMRHEPEPEPLHVEEEPIHPHEPIETDHHDEVVAPVAQDPVEAPPMDDWLDKAFANLALEPSPAAREADHGPSTQAEPDPLHAEHVTAQHDGEILYADEHEAAAHAPEPHGAPTAEDPHEPAHHEAEHEVPVGYDEPVHDHPVEHHLEPMTEPTPAAPNEPAVIGRYEADGTAYTMFADGSIEAQSDAGIYRFASMADLKAFIEG